MGGWPRLVYLRAQSTVPFVLSIPQCNQSFGNVTLLCVRKRQQVDVSPLAASEHRAAASQQQYARRHQQQQEN